MPIVRFFNWPFWPVSMLYAGIYLNVGLLEFTYYFGRANVHPLLVAFSAVFFGVFLYFGVAYAPACFGAEEDGGTLADLSKICFGRWPTFVLKYGLYPAWLVGWLLVSGSYAVAYLSFGLGRYDGFSLTDKLMFTLLWLAVVAPASGGTASQLARSSIFITKISLVAIIGLAISAKPQVIAPLDWSDVRGMTSLFEPFLFWGSPALLLIGYFTRQLRPTRRDTFCVGLAGIVIPLVIGTTCGVLTLTGRAALKHNQFPSGYFSYLEWTYIDGKALSQGKALVLAFTLLTAGRFAAFNLVQLIPLRRRLMGIWLLPGLILLREAFQLFQNVQGYWAETALLFFPLAGVFSALYLFARLRSGDFRSVDRRSQTILVMACVVGVALTVLPMQFPKKSFDEATFFQSDEYRFFAGPRLWTIQGWIASFAISWIALTLRHGQTAGIEEAAPETTLR